MRGLSKQRLLTVEVTVAASSSYVGFLEAYARALLSADTPVSRIRRWAADLFRGVRPELRFDASPDGDTGFSVAFPTVRTHRDAARLATEVFALPARIAKARKQRLAIALDEFQTVTTFDGGNVEHALRAAVQEQREVGYVFAGSEPSLMERMMTSKRPFYKAGPVMRLEKIDPEEFAAFIEERFTATSSPSRMAWAARLSNWAATCRMTCSGSPTKPGTMCARQGRTVGLDELHKTLTRLLGEQHMVFEESWQRLTLGQRAALRAIVIENGSEMLSSDVRNAIDLRHVQRPGSARGPGQAGRHPERTPVTSSPTRSIASGSRDGRTGG